MSVTEILRQLPDPNLRISDISQADDSITLDSAKRCYTPSHLRRRNPWLRERAITSSRKLHSLLVVCLFFCSVGVIYGQASFTEEVIGESTAGANCEQYSTTKLAISCTGSWATASAEGYEIATAKNGFGPMRAYSFSSVTLGDGEPAADSAPVNDIVLDHLSIVGLNGEPTAFLKFIFECLNCIQYDYPFAYYTAYAGAYGPCQIYGIGASPLCTLTVPIAYNGNGQPTPVYLQRELQINAITNVVGGPPGVTITTSVCVGYAAGGCGTIGATVKASVINAKGKVIKGVTVVGDSGHFYN